MKTKLISFIAFMLLAFGGIINAQESNYEKQMLAQIAKLKEVKTIDDFKSLSAVFKRIALAEQSHWEPYYYASFCDIIATLNSKNFTDEIADEIDLMVEKAFDLGGDESELYCLKSYLSTIRMLVNPPERYMSDGSKSKEFLTKSVEANPENPRAFLMFGESTLNTPEQFGGGKAKAMPYLEKAVELFATFKSDNPLHPVWGKSRAEAYMKAE